MKLAIMQPYLFPYIGYFQLLNAVDKFIILDDVHYIKKGWINRNRILLNKKPFLITLPLIKASQNKLINEIDIDWSSQKINKLLLTIQNAYKKADFFTDTMDLIDDIFSFQEKKLIKFIGNSIKKICDYLEINTLLLPSSSSHGNINLKGKDRIIDICKKENASSYINPIGGTELYNKSEFLNNNIKLLFLKNKNYIYNQFGNEFIPSLSIIDVLMFNHKEKIREILNEYELL